MLIAIFHAWSQSIALTFRIWDWLNGRPQAKLEAARMMLEEESRTMQLTGDLVGLRRTRAKLEEIDRKLRTRDF